MRREDWDELWWCTCAMDWRLELQKLFTGQVSGATPFEDDVCCMLMSMVCTWHLLLSGAAYGKGTVLAGLTCD